MNLQASKIILQPGELFVGLKPCEIMTVLGSCVAVCLYSEREGLGAMCHSVFPMEISGLPHRGPFPFVDTSVEYMLTKLQQTGASGIKAKVFGGADVIDLRVAAQKSIGRQNIEAAHHILHQKRIQIVTEKVGGIKGYKILFHSFSGDVRLSYVGS